jgi:hypothetical protein
LSRHCASRQAPQKRRQMPIYVFAKKRPMWLVMQAVAAGQSRHRIRESGSASRRGWLRQREAGQHRAGRRKLCTPDMDHMELAKTSNPRPEALYRGHLTSSSVPLSSRQGSGTAAREASLPIRVEHPRATRLEANRLLHCHMALSPYVLGDGCAAATFVCDVPGAGRAA